jgi:hypothetical protein
MTGGSGMHPVHARLVVPTMLAMDPLVLTFAFDSDAGAAQTSPERVNLAAMREFVREVERFLRGDDKEVDTAALDVAVVSGSFALRTEAIAFAPRLVSDLRQLAHSPVLDAVSPRRRDIMAAWQKRARGQKRQNFRIEASFLSKPVSVTASTDFHTEDANEWVRVERYMRGVLTELGGTHSVNAHIRLPDGKPLQVDATREQLSNVRENLVYKAVMVRFSADYNVRTNEYRAARLIEFTDYKPAFDEKAMQRLTERGAKAWADVDDAAAWVEGIREG